MFSPLKALVSYGGGHRHGAILIVSDDGQLLFYKVVASGRSEPQRVQIKSIRKIQPLVGLSLFGQPGWMPASQLIRAPSCIARP